jgi:tetratricopeptide (TPR) repeat protein
MGSREAEKHHRRSRTQGDEGLRTAMKKKTKKKKEPDGLDAILELFDRGTEAEGEAAVEAFEEGLRLARARWATDAGALTEDVDLVLWRTNLAITLQGLGEWERMHEVMVETMKGHPEDRPTDVRDEAEVLSLYAAAQQHVRKLDAALETIDRAIALDDEDADAHHERACILAWKGDVRGALESMRRSIELDPDERPEKLRDDTDFEDLKRNAEFRKLVGLEEEEEGQL